MRMVLQTILVGQVFFNHSSTTPSSLGKYLCAQNARSPSLENADFADFD